MKEILLSATRESWQVPSHHGGETDGSKRMKEVRSKVLSRDGGRCFFCDFTSQKWQEVHHISDNHDDYSMSNLATTCPLCHQCHHLGVAGSSGGGKIIWLPEMSQTELNHLCRAIFVASFDDNDTTMGASARSILAALESRANFLEQHFAPGASDPGLLGQVFLAFKKEEYERRGDFLKNIRMLALPGRFQAQTKYWRDTVYRDIPISSWTSLIKEAESLVEV